MKVSDVKQKPACKICGKEMTLLVEESQKWYCQKDGIVLYGKEQRWTEGNSRAQFKVALLSATSDDVEVAKRRFRINMGEYGQKNVEKEITRVERKAETPAQVIEWLKGRQDFYEAMRGITNLGLGGFVGSTFVNIGHKGPVPLIGSLTSEQEEWVNKTIVAMEKKLVHAKPIQCNICKKKMTLVNPDKQIWYCENDQAYYGLENRTQENVAPGLLGPTNVSATKFCRHCGAKIPKDSTYCEEYGTNLS